jgi:hypothetical protein
MQSRRHSAVETIANVLVGYAAAVASQFAIFPLFGIHVSSETHFAIGGWFTITSVIRSYTMRRLFNRWEDVR